MKIIFTAYSKKNFYFRAHISEFVLNKGYIPLNPFMLFDYFMQDKVERNIVREANNTLVRSAEELWVFGEISNGVFYEIQLAKEDKKPIRYFDIIDSQNIIETTEKEIIYEAGFEPKNEV